MNNLVLKLKNTKIRRGFKNNINSLIRKKKGGFDWVIGALIVAAIGVGLGIIFRNQINNILTSALNALATSINNLIAGVVN